MLLTARLPSGQDISERDAKIVLEVGPQLDRVYLVPFFHASLDGPEDSLVDMTLRFNLNSLTYEPKSVSVTVAEGAVNGVLLRQIRVQDLVKESAGAGVFVTIEPDKRDDLWPVSHWFQGEEKPLWATSAVLAEIKASGPTESSLNWVALAYNMASIAGQPPAKTVERDFDVSPRTAANWIAKAKDLGILSAPRLITGPAADG